MRLSALSSSSSSSSSSQSPVRGGSGSGGGLIVDVWQHNLRAEMERLVSLVDDYSFIAMDTEFPGIVARPVGPFKSSGEYHYSTLKLNVDLLKLIQLGLSFSDARGNLVPGACTWQFNFAFSLHSDMYAADSIELLQQSGIDFALHARDGIDVAEFGELLITSGIVLNADVRWISFHSSYDFAYLLRLLTCLPLPASEADFFDLLALYFPAFYDVKYLMQSCENLQGGLQKVGDLLHVERVGAQHQAGSDSLLTLAVFFKMKELFFEDHIDPDKFAGVLYGLQQHNAAQQQQQQQQQSAQPSPTHTQTQSAAQSKDAAGNGGGGNGNGASGNDAEKRAANHHHAQSNHVE